MTLKLMFTVASSFYLPFLDTFKTFQNFPFLGWNTAGLVFAR